MNLKNPGVSLNMRDTMDKKILAVKEKNDKAMNKLVKEDKKLDKKRDACESSLKMEKKKK
jgi:hypothetical protein